MKGLFCTHLDRKEEALELIKKGLKADLKSPICWHIYGLYYRGEKNYEEAVKCYIQSLRLEKVFISLNQGNFQILRDLATLQIQLGHYEAFNVHIY
jgi:N-alpha-acetyltransferase 15/16, NatA auxiliary subunit